ncbi:hypothetical protein VMT65_31170 [Nocardia sp. CDC153]|uniref:hypothetical protein n=1 Tax=Nocardia sp. CDC153 TaxID=3112167 RepID=UPI002DC020CA|nr:hypothetical protein [Nocardia sp. CDC153]MEC3957531.1 hypothetical protein [Nocardia sp. CDC153]
MTIQSASEPAHFDQIVPSAETARELTDRIKTLVEELWELIGQAYVSRIWVALDYRSWDDYCAAEFDHARIRVPREERTEVVASLREFGMSTRAIAAATGLGRGTVQRELDVLNAGVPNGTPDSVVGFDGKNYQPKSASVAEGAEPEIGDRSEPTRAPKRPPITKSFENARRKLCADAKSLARLIEDDRFDRYALQLAEQNLGDLWRAREALQAVLDRLPNPFQESLEG